MKGQSESAAGPLQPLQWVDKGEFTQRHHWNLLIFFCTNVTINHCPLRMEVAPQHFRTEPLILEHSKNINPRRMFSPKKNHPCKIFTPEKNSLMKNIHSWKVFTPEKYSPLKNIQPRKYSPPENIHSRKIFTPEKHSALIMHKIVYLSLSLSLSADFRNVPFSIINVYLVQIELKLDLGFSNLLWDSSSPLLASSLSEKMATSVVASLLCSSWKTKCETIFLFFFLDPILMQQCQEELAQTSTSTKVRAMS